MITTKDEIREALEQRRTTFHAEVEALREKLAAAEDNLNISTEALAHLDSDALRALTMAGLALSLKPRRRRNGKDAAE
jgi:hypothetical protein